MTKPEGFFPAEQLESRDPRGAEVLIRERAADQRDERQRKLLKETMVTRQGLFGPVTKSAWEWKQFDRKLTTIPAIKTKAKQRTRRRSKRRDRKPRQGFFSEEQITQFRIGTWKQNGIYGGDLTDDG